MAAPEAEIELSAEVVRALLAEQRPELAEMPITEVASGWDNILFRVGDDLAARMPRREIAVYLAANEQRWLTELAPGLPLPVPAPIFIGAPGAGYPWPWAIVPWFHGEEAARAEPSDWNATAGQLGAFLAALHQPAPTDAPPNPYRSVPLAGRGQWLADGLDALGDTVDRAQIEALWERAVTTPEWAAPKRWLHGDLHPRNIVVHDGRLAAIVDFGDMTAGDPAVDLSVAWFWLPPSSRKAFRSAYGGVDDDTWRRAKGWALCLSIAHLGGDDRVIPLGRHALAAVLADPP